MRGRVVGTYPAQRLPSRARRGATGRCGRAAGTLVVGTATHTAGHAHRRRHRRRRPGAGQEKQEGI